MKRFSGKKEKKGFTTVELMVVVVILVIAMGIVVPGLVRLYRNLKIAKLDDIAREIYTSAQSRTISLSVGGQLAQIESNEAQVVSDTPVRSATGVKYVYKSGDGSASGTEMILPLGSIEEVVRQNYYIIEYNPITGMVNGVYYWENEGNDFMSGGYGKINPESRDARMNYKGGMVGFYGGDDVERDGYASEVTADLVNGEELYLKIMQGRDGANILKGTITVTLTDLDKDVSREIASFRNESGPINGGNLSYNFNEVSAKGVVSYAPHYKLTLDSLHSKLRFSEICPEGADGSFHPGCNLKVTVAFREEGKRLQEESFLTNSLFASVEGDYDPSGLLASRTAYISCGRHLENLGLLWVYQGKATLTAKDLADTLNGVGKAVQTADIDWHRSLEAIGGNPAVSPVSFKPIVNGNLTAFDGGGNKISHMDIFGNVRSELLKGYTGSGNIGIGMFSRFDGDTLQNVNLLDCTVRDLAFNGSGLDVGLLAGTIDRVDSTCVVSDCHAYAEDHSKGTFSCSINVPENTTSTGGLFGFIRGTQMTKCSASLTEIAGNASYAGGLAGRIATGGAGFTVSQCYADTGIWSGSAEDGNWLKGISGKVIGGLVGRIEGSNAFTMENSYAVGWASAGNAHGLVGTSSNTSGACAVRYCYAALLEEGGIVGSLVPGSFASAADLGTCINYNGGYGDFNSLATEPSLPYVQREDRAERARATHAYGMPNTDINGIPTNDPVGGTGETTVYPPAYPFPRLSGMPHYGDWPQEGDGVQLVYYEVYKKDGKYSIGFHKMSGNKTHPLQDGKEYSVVMDGYALMFLVKDGEYDGVKMAELFEKEQPAATGVEDEQPSLSVKYNGTKVTDNNLRLMNAEEKFETLGGIAGKLGIDRVEGIEIGPENGKTRSYYPLFLSSAMMVENKITLAKKDSYYQKFEVQITVNENGAKTEKTVINGYFNPYVAKSDFVAIRENQAGASTGYPATPDVSFLRTSRQVTAYNFEAMQKTAVGNANVPHTLRLERDIALSENGKHFKTDGTVSENGNKLPCSNLGIDKTSGTDANVILELNGKILTGTGKGSVVSSEKGRLTVYGGTEDHPDMNGTIKDGGIHVETGVTGKLKNVTIKKPNNNVDIQVTDGVTMDGCKIISD